MKAVAVLLTRLYLAATSTRLTRSTFKASGSHGVTGRCTTVETTADSGQPRSSGPGWQPSLPSVLSPHSFPLLSGSLSSSGSSCFRSSLCLEHVGGGQGGD